MEQCSNGFTIISTEYSPGVYKENCINDITGQEHNFFLERCSLPETYYIEGVGSAYKEYEQFLKRFGNSKLKILDVGVGRGESSVFLALKGHEVHAIEPSEGFCSLIAKVSTKFNLGIKVYRAVAEDLLKIKINNFDLVVFNSSLHHCDNSLLALSNCYKILKPGGSIFLCAELHLRPWIRKKNWYRKLETHPVQTGHYGGNEHAYYTWEYCNMLKKVGFIKVGRFIADMYLSPLDRIEIGIAARLQGQRCWGEMQVLVRVFYYIFMSKLVRSKSMFRFLSKLSMMPCQFKAEKSEVC